MKCPHFLLASRDNTATSLPDLTQATDSLTHIWKSHEIPRYRKKSFMLRMHQVHQREDFSRKNDALRDEYLFPQTFAHLAVFRSA